MLSIASQLGPFVLLLLAIAVLPLVMPHRWEDNRVKAVIAFGLAFPAALGLLAQGETGIHHLLHALGEYVQFILLLSALYAISGVLVVHGDLRPGPVANTLWLALGAVLANFVGTTGASMLLIRPLLRANHRRRYNGHVPLFFVFLVANCGGLLLPLGDPPLFLGFLEGVDFFWTLQLWPQWLVVNGVLLLTFYLWDRRLWHIDAQHPVAPSVLAHNPLRVEGLVQGVLLLLGIMAVLLLQAPAVARALGATLRLVIPEVPELLLPSWAGALLLGGLAALAGVSVHRSPHKAKVLVWHPLLEVAILFAGIFVAMAPALELLATFPSLAWTPARLFWVTGCMSSMLDNAPTYLTFATLAHPGGPAALATEQPHWLQAISCGAVWMGALTYIGNGPNFLVRGVAEHMGYRMPSFFGYLSYSVLVLVPVFGLATFLFFR